MCIQSSWWNAWVRHCCVGHTTNHTTWWALQWRIRAFSQQLQTSGIPASQLGSNLPMHHVQPKLPSGSGMDEFISQKESKFSNILQTPKYYIKQELALPEDITKAIDDLAEDGPSYLVSMTIEGCAITEFPRRV